MRRKNIAGMILAISVCVTMVACLASCKQIEYVPVERVKLDSIYMTLHTRDSIYSRDSIYVKEKGDTVFKYRDRYLFVERAVRDTAYIERRDSVQVPYPVEKKLTRWQQFKLDVGGFALLAVAAVVLIGFGRFAYKLKKGG